MTLAERGVRESGLAWTFLCPRAFMSNALRWLPQLAEGNTVRVQFPDVVAACVDPADIGAVAARALTDDTHGGRIYNLTGPEPMKPADQLAVLAEVLNRNLTAVPLSDAETRAELEAAMPAQYVEAFFSFYVEGKLDESEVRSDVVDVTGRPARTFEQWAQAHAAEFTRP